MEISVSDQQDYPSLDQLSVCLQHESWTREQLLEYQAQTLRACRAYAYAHSPFYQRFHRGLMDRPLQELPVLTKAMMMEHFDELVTDPAIRLQEVRTYLAQNGTAGFFLDRYKILATSGSTGEPAIFLYNRTEAAIRGNSLFRCAIWGGITPASRVADVATLAPLVIDGKQATDFYISANETLETIVQRLNDWQPEVITGYSSFLVILAHEQRQGRLCISPKAVFGGGDTLPDSMRQRIEDAWHVTPYNSYAATESGAMASECSSHQGLHLFEDFSILEIVDEQNRPVPPGEQGEKALLTVLFRRTQPLIRYEISDLVRTSTREHCACGRPFALVENVEGRTNEMLFFPSPDGGEEKVNPYLFFPIFYPLPVNGWQVIQELDGLHVFLTGASDELRDEQVVEAFQQALSKRGVLVPAIQVHRVVALNKTASGKTPIVLSHVLRHTS